MWTPKLSFAWPMKLRDSRLTASTVTTTSLVELVLASVSTAEKPAKKLTEQTPTNVGRSVGGRIATPPASDLCNIASDVLCQRGVAHRLSIPELVVVNSLHVNAIAPTRVI